MKKVPVFIHIPKCAGTYIVSAVSSRQFRIASHIEGLAHQGEYEKISELIEKKYIISGHLTLPVFSNLSQHLDVDPVYHVSFRHPASQLVSLLNWQIEVALKGTSFLGTHPPAVISIIKELVSCDVSNPDSILQVVDKHPVYFLNNQSTFLLGDLESSKLLALNHSTILDKLAEALGNFFCMATEPGYDKLIDSLCQLGFASEVIDNTRFAPDLNSSRNHILFENKDIAEAFTEGVNHRQALDSLLYGSIHPANPDLSDKSRILDKLFSPTDLALSKRSLLIEEALKNIHKLEEMRQTSY